MVFSDHSLHRISLQFFAEGGDTGAGAGATGVTESAAEAQTGVKSSKNPLADVKYGKQAVEEAQDAAAPVTENPEADRAARFEALIKGEFKDLYDARMQDTVQKRLKGTKETVEKFEKLTPTLEMLSKKYGLKDASDVDALNKAIEEDDSYYEAEALEKGISVEQLKYVKKMERENADLKRQMQEESVRERADSLYKSWMEQSESIKSVYPSFDLRAEIQNPKFTDLLKNGIDVRTAYEVLHKDEIIPAAMQFTAKTVEQKLTNKIIANGARPKENGISAQSAAITKADVSQLTKADREEIIRRVARGEKITF